jgi:hypothetical protein
MRKIKYIGLCLLVILGFETVLAQFRYQKTIQPQSVRDGAKFIAIAVSEYGDIYLLESQFSEIYHLDQEGIILNRNGGFGWGLGQFDRPADIALSGLDVLVADRNNHRIVRYDRKLNYIATQDLRSETHPLIYPAAMAASRINELFILSVETAEVLRLYSEKNEQIWFGGIEYGAYALSQPVTLRMNDQGILTVLQQDGGLMQFDRYGAPLMFIPPPPGEKCEAIGLVAVEDNWLTLTENPANVCIYVPDDKVWLQIDLSCIQKPAALASAAFKNGCLYLLAKDSEILVLDYENVIRKP